MVLTFFLYDLDFEPGSDEFVVGATPRPARAPTDQRFSPVRLLNGHLKGLAGLPVDQVIALRGVHPSFDLKENNTCE